MCSFLSFSFYEFPQFLEGAKSSYTSGFGTYELPNTTIFHHCVCIDVINFHFSSQVNNQHRVCRLHLCHNPKKIWDPRSARSKIWDLWSNTSGSAEGSLGSSILCHNFVKGSWAFWILPSDFVEGSWGSWILAYDFVKWSWESWTLADPGGPTGPNSGLGGPKCGLAPLSETNFPYVNLVGLYHVGIGQFWPLPL